MRRRVSFVNVAELTCRKPYHRDVALASPVRGFDGDVRHNVRTRWFEGVLVMVVVARINVLWRQHLALKGFGAFFHYSRHVPWLSVFSIIRELRIVKPRGCVVALVCNRRRSRLRLGAGLFATARKIAR